MKDDLQRLSLVVAAGTPLERLRAICVGQPKAEERISHGEPAWLVKGGRQFAMFADRHHDGRVAFWCAAPPGIQGALVQEDPKRFFVPPYVGVRGWIGVYLDVPVDWDEVAEIVAEGYRSVLK